MRHGKHSADEPVYIDLLSSQDILRQQQHKAARSPASIGSTPAAAALSTVSSGEPTESHALIADCEMEAEHMSRRRRSSLPGVLDASIFDKSENDIASAKIQRSHSQPPTEESTGARRPQQPPSLASSLHGSKSTCRGSYDSNDDIGSSPYLEEMHTDEARDVCVPLAVEKNDTLFGTVKPSRAISHTNSCGTDVLPELQLPAESQPLDTAQTSFACGVEFEDDANTADDATARDDVPKPPPPVALSGGPGTEEPVSAHSGLHFGTNQVFHPLRRAVVEPSNMFLAVDARPWSASGRRADEAGLLAHDHPRRVSYRHQRKAKL